LKNFNYKKGLVLFGILLLPSILYLTLTTGKHNFVHLPVYYPLTTKDTIIKGRKLTDTIYHTIPPFTLVDQTGNKFTDKDLHGKIYVADFFFTTCPGICKDMAAQLIRVQEKFKTFQGFAIVSHTVDPKKDTLEALQDYARLVKADNKTWHLCTGNRDTIYALGVDQYKLPAQEDAKAPGGFLHSEYFVLVDKDKRIRGYYDGTKTTEVDKLIEDIKVLLAEYQLELKKNKWIDKKG
jgi:protein SCO1/2